MLQQSKLIKSREKWKNKAVQRATENREYRKQVKRYKKKITELKKQIKEIKSTHSDKKKTSFKTAQLKQA